MELQHAGVATLSEEYADLVSARADALVNPWNCNLLPWWSYSGGVSGALKRATGPEPWRELARVGYLRPGEVVTTGPGRVTTTSFIVHLAGLNLWWRATEEAVVAGSRNAVEIAAERGARTVAMPLVGAGTGGLSPERARGAVVRGVQDAHPRHDVAVRLVLWPAPEAA